MPPYRIFEHTADIGLQVSGKDFEELLKDAASGLYAVITDPAPLPETFRKEIELKAEDAGGMFLKWLRELLFYFSAKRMIFSRFEFRKADEKNIRVKVSGYMFDPATCHQKMEVKAVTYHAFEIQKQKDGGWTAQVILDI